MQRLRIAISLAAIRRYQSSATDRDADKTGVIVSIPSGAVVEPLGPSNLRRGMIDISWQGERYAVFEEDLTERGSLEQAVGQ